MIFLAVIACIGKKVFDFYISRQFVEYLFEVS